MSQKECIVQHAYIFDLDGTLLDSMDVWAKVDVDFLAENHIAIPKDYTQAVCCMGFQQAAAYTIERFHLALTEKQVMDRWLWMVRQEYACHVPLKPGAKEVLQALRTRRQPMAIVTALQEQLFRPCLQRHGIETWFDVFIEEGQADKDKSHPDLYRMAAQKLGVPPQNCIVFDDLAKALGGAKEAGMRTAGLYDKRSAFQWANVRQLADYAFETWDQALLQITR